MVRGSQARHDRKRPLIVAVLLLPACLGLWGCQGIGGSFRSPAPGPEAVCETCGPDGSSHGASSQAAASRRCPACGQAIPGSSGGQGALGKSSSGGGASHASGNCPDCGPGLPGASNGSSNMMQPYRCPRVAEMFRDDISADSGAPTPESESPIPEDEEESGGTTNPVLPRAGANRRRREGPDADRTPVSIQFPGPDLAGFPNSAFTLPKGRAYVESDPLAYYTPSKYRNLRYNWEFLLRYGLTDDVEFRLFSNGYTFLQTHPMPGAAMTGHAGRGAASHTTTGFSPLAFDLKIHLLDENRPYFIPATALEVYIQTTFGSPAFSNGTQPSVALNFDQGLPLGWTLEWSVGITGNETSRGLTYYQVAFQWSVQHNLIGDLDFYIHGFINNSDLPRLTGSLSSTTGPATADVLGIGGIYTVTKRFAIFGSFNWGLNPGAYSNIALLGGAYAF